MSELPRVPQTDHVPTAEHCEASPFLSQSYRRMGPAAPTFTAPSASRVRDLRQALFLTHAALGTEVDVPAAGESRYF